MLVFDWPRLSVTGNGSACGSELAVAADAAPGEQVMPSPPGGVFRWLLVLGPVAARVLPWDAGNHQDGLAVTCVFSVDKAEA